MIESLKATYNLEKDVINSYWLLNTLIDKVDEVPTDYDVDKVVEQLSDRSTLSRPVGWSKSYEIVTLKDAIEIVNQGRSGNGIETQCQNVMLENTQMKFWQL